MTQVTDNIQTIEVHFTHPVDENHLSFKTATKTKPIQAKPLVSVLSDKNVLTKFLLDTLEGKQNLQDVGQSVICLGGGGDVWQQKTSKLLQKYTVVNITEDGWLVCDPKPENEVWASQFTEFYDKFSIFAQWGEKNADGKYIQTGEVGDYILRSKTDPNDYWIVRKSFFESTYEFKEV